MFESILPTLTGIFLVLTVWFVSGFVHKSGEQAATKAEIKGLHRDLETLKTEFSAAVAKMAAAHGPRFAAELQVLRTLWEKMIELRDAGDQTWYESLVSGGAGVYLEFQAKLKRIHGEIDMVRPFIPPELYEPLLLAQLPIRRMTASLSPEILKDSEELKIFLKSHTSEITKGLLQLESAIRDRLWVDDDGLKALLGTEAKQENPRSS